jgi:YggT family protein
MLIQLLINLIRTLATILMIAVIVDVVLSYFLTPYHPIRSALDRVIQPLLTPIRKLVPPLGGIDFSPLILIILIQVVETLFIRFLALFW